MASINANHQADLTSNNQPKTPNSPLKRNKKRHIMPFFNLSLGISVLALSIIVLLPFVAMVMTTADIGVAGFIKTIAEPRVKAAIGVWYADCMGIGALRVLGKVDFKCAGGFALCFANGGNGYFASNLICTQWFNRAVFCAIRH